MNFYGFLGHQTLYIYSHFCSQKLKTDIMSIDSIRINADIIGHLIGIKNKAELQFPELQKLSKLSDDIYTAIGWLACENKIETDVTTQESVCRLPVIYSQYY